MEPQPDTTLTPQLTAAETPPSVTERRRGWAARSIPLALGVVALAVGGLMLMNATPTTSSGLTVTANIYGFDMGTPAPEFSLETLDGKRVSLSDFRGKAVLLNFWATWCPPCRSEMPDMQQIYEERGADDVVVLAVNLQEAPEPVKTFVGKYGLRFPILMDMTGEISQAYRVSTLPTSFFIDKDGNMSSFNIGALNRTAMLKRIDRSVEPQP